MMVLKKQAGSFDPLIKKKKVALSFPSSWIFSAQVQDLGYSRFSHASWPFHPENGWWGVRVEGRNGPVDDMLDVLFMSFGNPGTKS